MEQIEVTADVVSAFVAGNRITPDELPALIRSVHTTFSAIANGETAEPVAEVAELKPAVPIKKSVTPDYLICLETGKKMKTMKKHLRVNLGMTPEQYRAKWGLPVDYPMVAPNYSAFRAEQAKNNTFGRPARTSE